VKREGEKQGGEARTPKQKHRRGKHRPIGPTEQKKGVFGFEPKKEAMSNHKVGRSRGDSKAGSPDVTLSNQLTGNAINNGKGRAIGGE